MSEIQEYTLTVGNEVITVKQGTILMSAELIIGDVNVELSYRQAHALRYLLESIVGKEYTTQLTRCVKFAGYIFFSITSEECQADSDAALGKSKL